MIAKTASNLHDFSGNLNTILICKINKIQNEKNSCTYSDGVWYGIYIIECFWKSFFSTGPLPRRFILKLTCVDRYHQSWGRAEYFQTRSGGCKFWNTFHSRPLAMSNMKGPNQGSRIEGNTVILAINAVCGVTSEKQRTLLRLCHQKAERAHLSKIRNF